MMPYFLKNSAFYLLSFLSLFSVMPYFLPIPYPFFYGAFFLSVIFYFFKDNFEINARQFFLLFLYGVLLFLYFLNINFARYSFTDFLGINKVFLLGVVPFCAFLMIFSSKGNIKKFYKAHYLAGTLFIVYNFFDLLRVGFDVTPFLNDRIFNIQQRSIVIGFFSLSHFSYLFFGKLKVLRFLSGAFLFFMFYIVLKIGGASGGGFMILAPFLLFFSLMKSRRDLLKFLLLFVGFMILGFIFLKDSYLFLRLMGKFQPEKFSRLHLIWSGLIAFLDAPWGAGIAKTSVYAGLGHLKGYYPHNVFIEVLAEAGICAFLSIIVFFVLSLKNFFMLLKNDGDIYQAFMFLLLLKFFLLSFFVAHMGSPFFHLLLAGLIGIQKNISIKEADA